MAYFAEGLMFEILQSFFRIQMEAEFGHRWKEIVADKILEKFDHDSSFKEIYKNVYDVIKKKGIIAFSEKDCDFQCILSLLYYDFLSVCEVGQAYDLRIKKFRDVRSYMLHNPDPDDYTYNMTINYNILQAVKEFLDYLSENDWNYEGKDAFIQLYRKELDRYYKLMAMNEDKCVYLRNNLVSNTGMVLSREHLICEISDALSYQGLVGTNRMVYIRGIGGIGKSTLVLQTVLRLQNRRKIQELMQKNIRIAMK